MNKSVLGADLEAEREKAFMASITVAIFSDL